MSTESDEFIKFATKQQDGLKPALTLAKAKDGAIWLRTDPNTWETTGNTEPKRTRTGLTTSELYLLLVHDRARRG